MTKLLRFSFFILGILCIGLIVIPILDIFVTLAAKELVKTIYDREVWQALLTSFIGASLATVLGCILGVPLAYLLSRYDFKGKRIIEGIANLPIVIPHVAVGIALLCLLNEKTHLGNIFAYFHITFVDTIYGVIMALVFVSISYVIVSASIGFNGVDQTLEWVSRNLGASMAYTFWHITFPLALSAIVRGAILAFARSISEVGALLILAYYPKTAPILMYERFEQFGLEAALPVTALVVFFSLFIFVILLSLSRNHALR